MLAICSTAATQRFVLTEKNKSRVINLPLGVYQLPMSVKTPTANGLSSIPSTKRSANTVFTFFTDAKQKVTIVQRSSAVGRYSEGLT